MRCHTIPALLVLSTLAAADPVASLRQIESDLRQELSTRIANDGKMASRELRLSLEQALRFNSNRRYHPHIEDGQLMEDVEIRFYERNGTLVKPELAGLSSRFASTFNLDGLDISGLRLDESRLQGRVDITYFISRFRRDLITFCTFHHVDPVDVPVPFWNLGGIQRANPFTQRFSVDCPAAGLRGWMLRMNIPKAFDPGAIIPETEEGKWGAVIDQKLGEEVQRLRQGGKTLSEEEIGVLRQDLKKAMQTEQRDRGGNPQRLTVFARLDERGRVLDGWAFGYNRAGHDVHTSGLTVKADEITGGLTIRINSDSWLSGRGSQTISFTAKPDPDGRFTAPFTTKGAYRSDSGTLTGRLTPWIGGRFTSEGSEGSVSGRAFLEITPSSVTLPAPIPAQADPVATCVALHRQIRVLTRLRDLYPLELAVAEAREQAPDPVPPVDPSARQQGLEWLAAHAVVKGTSKDPVAQGTSACSDPAFGPWQETSMIQALPSPEGRARLAKVEPAAPQRWAFVPAWRWSGPLPMRTASAHDGLYNALGHAQSFDRIDYNEPAFLVSTPPCEGWSIGTDALAYGTIETTPTPWMLPKALERVVSQRAPPGFIWYAVCEVESSLAQSTWAAVPAHQAGAVWINGRLVWQGGKRADALDTAIFPIRFEAGRNQIVLQAGIDEIAWKNAKSVRGNARERMAAAHTGLMLALGGAPQTTAATTSTSSLAETVIKPATGTPPLAWSIATGTNVRWSVPVSADLQRLLAIDEARLMTITPTTVQALTLADGKPLWKYDGCPPLRAVIAPGGRVIIQGGDGQVVAMDVTGKVCWKQNLAMVGTGALLKADQIELKLVTADGQRSVLDAAGNCLWQSADQPDARVQAAIPYDSIRHGILANKSANSSPVFTGRLLVHEGFAIHNGLVVTRYQGLDPSDGAIKWTQDFPEGYAGLMGLELRAGSQMRRLVLTGSPDLLDADTGAILHRDLTLITAAGVMPVADAEGLIWAGGGSDAWIAGWQSGWKARVEVWLDAAGQVNVKHQWRAEGPSHYGGPPGQVSGPYFFMQRCNGGHHQEGPAPYVKMHVYDRRRGTLLGEEARLMDSRVAPKSLDLVDGRLYAADIGGKQYFSTTQFGLMVVAQPHDPPQVIAESEIPTGPVPPLFVNHCVLVAGEAQLHCLAADTPAGKAYQSQNMAATIAARVGSKPLAEELWVKVDPLAKPVDPDLVPVTPFRTRTGLQRGLVLGPFPSEVPDAILSAAGIGNPQAVPQAGQVCDIGGHSYTWRKSGDEITTFGSNWQKFGNYLGFYTQYGIDLWTLMQRRDQQRVLVFGVWRVDQPGCYLIQGADKGVRVWLSGQELPGGSQFELQPGCYPMFMCVQIGKMPQFLAQRQIKIGIRFQAIKPLKQKQAEFFAKVRQWLPLIKEALAGSNQGAGAAQLRHCLLSLPENAKPLAGSSPATP